MASSLLSPAEAEASPSASKDSITDSMQAATKDEEKETVESSSTSTGTDNTHDVIQLYAFLAQSVATELNEFTDRALSEGVPKHPLSQNSTGSELHLMNKIRKVYLKNIDLFDLYGKRSIFSIEMFPKRRQEEIEKLYQDSSFDHQSYQKPLPFKPLDVNVSATQINQNSSSDNPLLEEIPNQEHVDTRLQEKLELRKRLGELRRRREQIFQEIERIQVVKEMVDIADEAVQEKNNNMSVEHQQVTDAVMKCKSMQELQAVGQQLKSQLQTIEDERDDIEDQDDLELYHPVPPKRRKELEDVEGKLKRLRPDFSDLQNWDEDKDHDF